MSQYPATYSVWQSDPVGFWGRAGKDIDWFTPGTSVFNADCGVYGRWFDGTTCNICYNCVDRHIEAGHRDRQAVIHDSPVTDTVVRNTYDELKDQVIHNSNYATKDAIDRYFLERDEYSRKHPKRAGNKLWVKEPSASGFSDSNNCKDPRYR